MAAPRDPVFTLPKERRLRAPINRAYVDFATAVGAARTRPLLPLMPAELTKRIGDHLSDISQAEPFIESEVLPMFKVNAGELIKDAILNGWLNQRNVRSMLTLSQQIHARVKQQPSLLHKFTDVNPNSTKAIYRNFLEQSSLKYAEGESEISISFPHFSFDQLSDFEHASLPFLNINHVDTAFSLSVERRNDHIYPPENHTKLYMEISMQRNEYGEKVMPTVTFQYTILTVQEVTTITKFILLYQTLIELYTTGTTREYNHLKLYELFQTLDTPKITNRVDGYMLEGTKDNIKYECLSHEFLLTKERGATIEIEGTRPQGTIYGDQRLNDFVVYVDNADFSNYYTKKQKSIPKRIALNPVWGDNQIPFELIQAGFEFFVDAL